MQSSPRIRLLLATASAAACILCSVVHAADPVDESARLFQRIGHYIVDDQKILNELTSTPLPFLDWGYVQPGFIAYVDKQTRQVVPLNDEHNLTSPDQVEAIPIASPSGVQIRVQQPTRGGLFAETLFEPKFPWEEECDVHTLVYDDADQLYKLWYRTKDLYAYAESKDFKTWERPLASHVAYDDQHPQTNIVGIVGGAEAPIGDLRSFEEAKPGGNAFFVDPSSPPEERYKVTFLGHVKNPDTREYARESGMPLSAMTDPPSTVMFGAVSADGIGWRVLPKPIMLHDADTNSVTKYDTLLKKYVMYTRLYELGRRSIGYSETTDFARWPLPKNLLSADTDEHPSVDYYANAFAFYPGRPEIRTLLPLVYNRFVDRSEIRLASSRDGHGFQFVAGGPVIPAGEPGAPDSPGFLSAQPSLVRTPDGKMIFFYDASRVPHKFPRHRFGGSKQFAAWWPADRLAALEAPEQGAFTTAALTLRGNRVILNMQTERTGGIEVELRDDKFNPVPGRTFADADKLYGDEQAMTATWKGESDVSAQKDQTIFLCFRLRAAKLFAIAASE